ncbi:unnamed protein product [Ilex paraguariensis]|uniref:Uncharacterized protein n=1 Tax=Ilex paraguariensis TaxID=185542 RepID=A0ABC8RCL2_9AQUA
MEKTPVNAAEATSGNFSWPWVDSDSSVMEEVDETMSNNQVEDLDTNENPDSFLDGSVMEKILQRRSLRMRNMQRAWLGSSEGRKMLDFRRSLRAFKEKERLLQAIARNQTLCLLDIFAENNP